MGLFKLIARLFTGVESQNARMQRELHSGANANEEDRLNSIQRQLQEMAAIAKEERLNNIQRQLKEMAATAREGRAAKQRSSQGSASENCREIPQDNGSSDQHQGAGNSFGYLTHDDDTLINPATGLLMVGGIAGIDVMGNVFGADGSDDMLAYINMANSLGDVNPANSLGDVNPANGMPMDGDLDVMSNPYGTDLSTDFSTDTYQDLHTDFNDSDFSSSSDSDW